uniref:Uncharacterized protein n=1 Tax=Knipowitschia caucasica TaxID=637954 RepID=A0AAV2LNS7_KNICA
MAAFYLVILGTGIWASMRSKREEKKWTGDGMEITLLAGRNINLLVGIFTLTATWVGGGFILGIAEATYNPTLGAVWALMPVPYVVTFFLARPTVPCSGRSGDFLCSGQGNSCSGSAPVVYLLSRLLQDRQCLVLGGRWDFDAVL